MNKIKTNLIVAVDSKWGFSKNGIIPWKIKEDYNFFLDTTKRVYLNDTKNAVIMGKNTWKSLPENFRGLNGRANVIVSTTMTDEEVILDNKTNAVVHLVKSLQDGIKLCHQHKYGKIFIGGGYSIYKEALLNTEIDEIYLSSIGKDYGCDNIFPHSEFSQLVNNYKIQSSKNFIVTDQISKEMVPIIFTKYYKNEVPKCINYEEQQYLDLIEEILKKGTLRETRNAKVYSLFGKHFEFNLENGFPILTTKKINFKGVFEEASFFLSGKTDVQILSDKGIKIWNPNTTREFLDANGLNNYKEYDMGPMYPFQFRHFGLEYEGKDKDYTGGFDQIQYCLNLIKNDPYSRRNIMTSFNPAQAKEGVLYPCHSLIIQWYVEENNKLSMSMYNRSQDMVLGNPWNISYGALLIHLFCEVINNDLSYTGNKLLPGRLIVNMGDVHIYDTHYEQSIRQILREPYTFPKLIFKRKVTDFKDIKFEDLELVNYDCYPGIIAKMVA